MKFKKYTCRIIIFGIAIIFLNGFRGELPKKTSQDDPVLAPEVSAPPVIDGTGDDQCWQNLPWQSIDQVWIPYGGSVTSDDYSGHYKVVWSSTTNLLYFLIEVNDDVFVDGFQDGVTADVYNFDIAEVFIDEDNSGGLHIFDATGNDANQYGSNAENAFTYHIYADFPEEGEITHEHFVADLDGTNWSNVINRNYAAHIPEFSLTKSGNTAVWEFSLMVYNDTYEEDSNQQPARVQLQAEKEMGLSVAYCDNDNPDETPKQRDNMYGSVWEPSPGNLHWMNADYFGTVKLVSENETGVADEKDERAEIIKYYPNPASTSLNLLLKSAYNGNISFRLYNILGEEVLRKDASKTGGTFTQRFTVNSLTNGLYFLQTQMGKYVFCEKIIISNNR